MANEDTDDESLLADEKHTISPGDIIEYHDETIVYGKDNAMKRTQVMHLCKASKGYMYLDDAYCLNRDTRVKVLYKYSGNFVVQQLLFCNMRVIINLSNSRISVKF